MQEELGLRLSSLYTNAELINPNTWPGERDTLHSIVRILAGFGAPLLVIGGGPPDRPDRPRETSRLRPLLPLARGDRRDRRLARAETAYHPHLDTLVETREQLDEVMARLDTSKCGLCIDPAHLIQAGSDPVAAVRDYGEAIRYMHFKDTYAPQGAVGPARYAAFCELGAGAVDLPAITAELLRQGYDGLAIIELDRSEKTAEESARESVAYIRDTLGLELTPA